MRSFDIRSIRLALFITVLATTSGCMSELLTADMPLTLDAPSGTPLTQQIGARFEGVYYVAAGHDTFGDTLVALWRGGHLCFYAATEVIFVETAGARTADSDIAFTGYYRFVRSAATGDVTISALASKGATDILHGLTPARLTLTGQYIDEHGLSRTIQLERARLVPTTPLPYYVIGHRGGGRNSERLGRSENSIEMIAFAERLGCNAIEIDLQTTSDGVVIVMHDDQFSPRTVQTTYILGDVDHFTFDQIRRNARLLHGEHIPSLDEVLNYVVDSTNLTLIWLDPKNASVTESALQAQRRAMDRAKAKGRTLTVLYDITTFDMLRAYRAAPSANQTPVLCELTANVALTLPSCLCWAPRWTLGTQDGAVGAVRAKGMMVFPWTIDSPEYMTQFLNSTAGKDGILSDYPSMLTAQYYLRE